MGSLPQSLYSLDKQSALLWSLSVLILIFKQYSPFTMFSSSQQSVDIEMVQKSGNGIILAHRMSFRQQSPCKPMQKIELPLDPSVSFSSAASDSIFQCFVHIQENIDQPHQRQCARFILDGLRTCHIKSRKLTGRLWCHLFKPFWIDGWFVSVHLKNQTLVENRMEKPVVSNVYL